MATRTPTTSCATASRCTPSTRPATPTRYPDAGEPWQPLKLYYNQTFTKARTTALHEGMLAAGLESPYGEWLERWEDRDERTDHHPRAVRATTSRSATGPCSRTPPRSTPTAPGSPARSSSSAEVWPTEDFELARVAPGLDVPTELEDDLFAGVHDGAGVVGERAMTIGDRRSLFGLDKSNVNPGVLGFVVVALLGVATWLLIRSMQRHLRKVDFDEGGGEP